MPAASAAIECMCGGILRGAIPHAAAPARIHRSRHARPSRWEWGRRPPSTALIDGVLAVAAALCGSRPVGEPSPGPIRMARSPAMRRQISATMDRRGVRRWPGVHPDRRGRAGAGARHPGVRGALSDAGGACPRPLGRWPMHPGEDPEAPHHRLVILPSHAAWQTRFSGDPTYHRPQTRSSTGCRTKSSR